MLFSDIMKRLQLDLFLKTLVGITFVLIILISTRADAGKTAIQTASAWKDFSKQQHVVIDDGFPYIECFKESATENNIPIALLLAVARGESDFQATAKSKKNCYGIMQIQWPGTAKDLGFKNKSELLSPCKNIKAGGRYLRMLLDRYQGDIHLAIAAYNYGLGRIKKGSHKIPDGAVWYSGYIFDHLQTVLASATTGSKKIYTETNKKRIVVFNDPGRAENFLESMRKSIPEVRFDWFRMGLGRFQIVFCYTDKKELERGQRLLEKRFGFSLSGVGSS